MSLTLTRRHNVDRFGYLIPTKYGNVPMVGAVATYRPGEGRFGGAVAVEEGTTNLWSGTSDKTRTYRRNEGSWITFVSDNEILVDFTVEGPTVDNLLYYPSLNDVSEGPYTFSVEYEVYEFHTTASEANGFYLYIRDASSNVLGQSEILQPKPGERGRLHVTVNNPAENTSFSRVAVAWGNNMAVGDRVRMRVFNFQIEAKPFATSFVDGTRAEGVLQYSASGIINPDAGTIAFWYRPEFDLSLVQDHRTSPKLIQVGNYASNGSFTLWHYSDPGRFRLYVRGQDATDWTAYGTVSPSDTGFARGKWSYVAVTWDGLNWAVYMDGRRVLSVTSSQPLGRINGDIWQFAQGSPKYSQLFDELLILPYAASEEEIVSWYEAQGSLPPHPQASLQWDRQTVRPAQMTIL